MAVPDIKMPSTSIGGSRLIGGLPLLILMTLNGNSGLDLLDALINWVSSLAVAVPQ